MLTILELKKDTKRTFIRGLTEGTKVDWGDGTNTVVNNAQANSEYIVHTYNTTENYARRITIEGLIERGPFSKSLVDPDTLTAVRRMGAIKGTLYNLFYKCNNLTGFFGTFDGTYLTDTSAENCFSGCNALRNINPYVFNKCTKLANFRGCFNGCSSLVVESPYTMVNGKKIKLWERSPENGFSKPIKYDYCFMGCYKLPDINSVPTDWK